ncbi:hypothetical protein C8Q78DRAFT_1027980 [Trametes maxima]|nr:hypothetical protein C8Q78DRAFT_1027980 [Trametes maxima]
MDSDHFGLIWSGFSRPTRANPLLRTIPGVCCISCAMLPSLLRLAEAFSCVLQAPTAQELPNESVTLHSFSLNPLLTPYSLC